MGKPHYEQYHDQEWGIPTHNDAKLFEMLILEGAQAGLNWETVLKKREGYRKAFCSFDPKQVARLTDEYLAGLLNDSTIIRNKLKVFSARKNAKVFLEIQQERTSFSSYVWSFVGGSPIVNHPKSLKDIPTHTPESDKLSKDLKKRGMSFVGTTIMYAYMQAVGMVDDHLVGCWCKGRIHKQIN